MPFRLRKKESISAAVRRMAREEIDKAIDELKEVATGKPSGLHESRKRIKKLRALVRLVAARLDRSAKHVIQLLREAAGPLSGARDAQAMVEAFDVLMQTALTPEEARDFAPVREVLIARREAAHESEAQWATVIAGPIERLREVRAISQGWTIRPNGFAALSRGLLKSYRRAVEALHLAYANPSDEHFHEWRKHVKSHWYHVRLLRGLWPKLMIATAFELGTLSDLLGDDHDLAVMRNLLTTDNAAPQVDRAALLQMIDDRRRALRRSAKVLGQRLFAEKPKQLRRRFRAYWNAWHAEDVKVEEVLGNVAAPAADDAAPAPNSDANASELPSPPHDQDLPELAPTI